MGENNKEPCSKIKKGFRAEKKRYVYQIRNLKIGQKNSVIFSVARKLFFDVFFFCANKKKLDHFFLY